MSVRHCVAADVPRLAAGLAALPLMQRYGRDAAALERNLTSALGRGDGLLAYDNGQGPLGLAWFQTQGTFALGGYLRLIAVFADAQTRGAGAALLGAYEEATFAASAHAFLLVSDFNHDAQRFYERHGYARVGALPGLVLADVAELIYWKRRP